jgi:hypothetical protein
MSTEKIDLDIVWKKIMAYVGENFPNGKLKNRLQNLGLEDFVGQDGTFTGSIIARYGFPFKFTRQLDESVLVLAHFLDRFRKEGGSLEIYALNRVSKGEDKNLSFWQDAKAKLYLELQNIILLLNGIGGRTSKIRRIFTFRELSDLAFLTQAGINVLGEQVATGIDIGFMFLDVFTNRSGIEPISDTLIVNFEPKNPPRDRHNFYELYSSADESRRHDLPYQELCTSKWFKNLDAATSVEDEKRLRELLKLYKEDETHYTEWEKLAPGYAHKICKFERETGVFFNDATVMMYKAFKGSDIQTNYESGDDFIINRINKTVITQDMIRLHRAMSDFTDTKEIKAVDATSTKGSLKIHESRPTYRDWLRRSLNRVLKSDDKRLHRIYILKDNKEDKNIEYQTLLRLMQYYSDYFHYEISEMAAIVHRHTLEEYSNDLSAFPNQGWLKTQWNSFPNRVSVRITTSRVLEKFAAEVLKEESYPEMFGKILPDSKALQPYEYLSVLDYLYTDNMIYNFLNPRADTDELKFPAYLYRNSLNVWGEQNILFNFTDLEPLKKLQTQNRLNLLATSILQYANTYKDELNKEIKDNADMIKEIGDVLKAGAGNRNVDPRWQSDLVKIRATFEKKLYREFKPHFDYLYNVLKYQSIEVKFWDDINERLVHNLSPFNLCTDADGLKELIEETVSRRLKDGEPLPKLDELESENMDARPKIFISYAHLDKEKVVEIHRKLISEGFSPWMDTQIHGGETWLTAIEIALEGSDFQLIILSKNSSDRRGEIQVEIKKALEIRDRMLGTDIGLIPVRLEEVEIPRELRGIQWIDLFKPDGWGKLIAALQEGMRRRREGS